MIQPVWGESAPAKFTPLLVTSRGQVLAAIYSHPVIEEVWWLPVEASDAEDFDFASWLSAALDAWHLEDSDRFPGPPDWTRSKNWMTHEELQLVGAIERAEFEMEQRLAELSAQVEERKLALAEAQERHDRAERALLTGQGEELAAAVKAALERLGFQVENRDESRQGQKLEDLRVRDPASPWIALVEVKGYDTSGGKPSDLAKIARFAGIYAAVEQGLPDASWYVVNQYRLTSPDRRRALMRNHGEDVERFVQQDNGVLVDTCELFLLDRRVSSGDLAPEEARTMLMSAARAFHCEQ
ncbi:hypothetical protein H7K45_02110 [Mycobacterium yunnanensis]|uniref:Uncharacterized protein n=1 Tax=Mycobacterium yunnanensis TaxID=368477 RepID=A0A9X2YW04_9MYCO|nr:hypothetical protein [Mycobacterium yunnanensis]MCV7419324.1 hypothetical protein [Mycobacterium yunnanensis]